MKLEVPLSLHFHRLSVPLYSPSVGLPTEQFAIEENSRMRVSQIYESHAETIRSCNSSESMHADGLRLNPDRMQTFFRRRNEVKQRSPLDKSVNVREHSLPPQPHASLLSGVRPHTNVSQHPRHSVRGKHPPPLAQGNQHF